MPTPRSDGDGAGAGRMHGDRLFDPGRVPAMRTMLRHAREAALGHVATVGGLRGVVRLEATCRASLAGATRRSALRRDRDARRALAARDEHRVRDRARHGRQPRQPLHGAHGPSRRRGRPHGAAAAAAGRERRRSRPLSRGSRRRSRPDHALDHPLRLRAPRDRRLLARRPHLAAPRRRRPARSAPARRRRDLPADRSRARDARDPALRSPPLPGVRAPEPAAPAGRGRSPARRPASARRSARDPHHPRLGSAGHLPALRLREPRSVLPRRGGGPAPRLDPRPDPTRRGRSTR